MSDFKILKFLDKFKGLFEKLGVNYDIMRKILEAKLTMDERRVPTIINKSSKKKDMYDEGNSFKKSLWIYTLLGLILLPFVLMGKNYIFQMSFVFGIIMFMIMTTLISDFSSVLLDIRDKNILSTKPVDSKTISMAKTVHIFIYMFSITIFLTAPALIASLIKHGIIFFIIFLIEIVLMDLFIVILTALLYMLILKFFDGEKLKDIINYVQIILTITLTIGYQLLGRLFNLMDLKVTFAPKWWQYFIVPIWFGAPFEVLMKGEFSSYFITFSILAIVVPIISIILYLKLTPTFERNLQKLNNNNGRAKKKSSKFTDNLLRIICPNKDERVFFKFASSMMTNERDFKLKVYPSLGMAIIFPFIFIFNFSNSGALSSISSSKAYLNIYFCALILPTIVMMLKYSGRYKGSWLYKTTPLKEASPIFKGTLKALLAKLIFPIYILESIIFIFIFGLRIIPDLILVFLNMILFMLICFKVMRKSLPFSEPFEAAQQSEGLIVIPLMLLLGALVGLHYASTLINFGVYMYIALMIIIDFILWKKILNISWENV